MIVVFVFILAVFCAFPAYAYIGPGLGVALVWTLLGPIAAVIAAVALIAYFPLRYYYKKHQAHKKSLKDPKDHDDSRPS